MKKFARIDFILKFIMIVVFTNLNFQIKAQSVEERLQKLENDVVSLQNKYDSLYTINRQRDSILYETNRQNVLAGVEISNKMVALFSKINSDIDNDLLHLTLYDLNNPTSENLGFSFVSLIEASIENVFSLEKFKSIPKKSKGRFKIIVQKIINNPVVSAVANAFPITGTIRSIITAASTFFGDPSVSLEPSEELNDTAKNNDKKNKDAKEFFKNTSAKVIADNGFDNDFVKCLLGELLPILNFYEALESANLDRRYALNDLKFRDMSLGKQITDVDSLITVSLNLTPNSITSSQLDEVNKYFSYHGSIANKNFDYHVKNCDENIINCNNFSKQIGFLELELAAYYNEYTQIQENWYNQYIEALKKAKTDVRKPSGQETNIKNEIDKVIAEIQSSIDKRSFVRYEDDFKELGILRDKIIY